MTNELNLEQERREFEAVYAARYGLRYEDFNLLFNADSKRYKYDREQAAWEGWLDAKRAAMGSAEPVATVVNNWRDDDGNLVNARIVTLGDFDLEHVAHGTKLYTTPPAPVSAEPQTSYEQRKAIQEGEQIAASDGYFSARTHLMDTPANRNIFRAGYDRGYETGNCDREIGVSYVTSPVPVSAEPEATSQRVKDLIGKLDEWRYRMSYNDSYFGEPKGFLKETVRQLTKAADATPTAPPAAAKDAERLDWLIANNAVVESFFSHVGKKYRVAWMSTSDCQADWFDTHRAAIDAAREAK